MAGGAVLWDGAIYAGVAGIAGPLMCWCAGSGLSSATKAGRPAHRAAVIVGALLFAAIGIGMVIHSGFSLGMFGLGVPGIVWCVIGLVVGWL